MPFCESRYHHWVAPSAFSSWARPENPLIGQQCIRKTGLRPDKQTDKSSTRWGLLVLLMVIVLVTPVYEQVQQVIEPSLGVWAAFALAVLAASAVALPFFFAMNWVIQREQRGMTDDLPAMVYRPAILPVWVFATAAIKNIHETLTDITAWVFLGWLTHPAYGGRWSYNIAEAEFGHGGSLYQSGLSLRSSLSLPRFSWSA